MESDTWPNMPADHRRILENIVEREVNVSRELCTL